MKSCQALIIGLFLIDLPLHAAGLDDLTYTTTDGEVTITDCNEAASGELVIPDIIEGNSVGYIGDNAFTGCISLKSITIPNSVTSIGVGAFNSCLSLTSITISDEVTNIGKGAFMGCKVLTSITIPDNVTRIGGHVFVGCINLAEVIFLGDAPKVGVHVLLGNTSTIYRKPEAKGWGDTFAGRPVNLISEKPVEEKVLEVKKEVKTEEHIAENKPKLDGITLKELEFRGGIWHLKGSDTTYTGKVYWLYPNGKKKQEAHFKDGKHDGLIFVWHPNGKKKLEGRGKDGKMVEGSAKYWNSKGEPVDSEEEAFK